MKIFIKTSVVLATLLFATPVMAVDAGAPKDAAATVAADSGKVVTDAAPAVVIDLPKEVPQDLGGAVDLAKDAFQAGAAKNWWLMSASIIWLLMFGLKMGGLFDKIGRRWAYILVPVLSLAAMLLSKFAGDLSWAAAAAVLTSGPSAALMNDFVKRGILAKEPDNTIKKPAKEEPEANE